MAVKKSYFEYLQGKGNWIKANIPDPKFRKWSMMLYPNDASLQKFKLLQDEGLLTRLRKDDDGYFFQLSRPQDKIMRGEKVIFQAPQLMDKDGNLLEPTIRIGNGSDVTAKVQIYYYPKPTGGSGVAMRWEGLKIDTLVPYNPKDLNLEGQLQVEGLKEQPREQLW